MNVARGRGGGLCSLGTPPVDSTALISFDGRVAIRPTPRVVIGVTMRYRSTIRGSASSDAMFSEPAADEINLCVAQESRGMTDI